MNGILTKERVFFVRSLYGLNSSGLSWRNHLYEILGKHLILHSYLADPGVWFKAAIDKAGDEYYACIIVYVDYFINVENILESTWPYWRVSTKQKPLLLESPGYIFEIIL